MSEKGYRKVLMDCVSTMTEYDGGMGSDDVIDIQNEINRVYEESELLSMVRDVFEDDTIDSAKQYAKIYSLIQGYQLSLF